MLLQCSPCQESYCSNFKKNFGDREAVGGFFFMCFLSIIGFREPIGYALSKEETRVWKGLQVAKQGQK